jgi:hypothetical protein
MRASATFLPGRRRSTRPSVADFLGSFLEQPLLSFVSRYERASQHGICGSVPAVGRSRQICLVLAATLGLSGCLLFSDPINRAPTVKISPVTPTQVVYRGQDLFFTAAVSDDRDPVSDLSLRWHEFLVDESAKNCSGLSWPPNPGTPSSPYDQYKFEATSLGVTCLCAQVTDKNGATGQDCYRIATQNPPLKAAITDETGAISNSTRSLCSQIHLSAESSTYPDQNPISFAWQMVYAGTDSAGKSISLGPCDGITTNKDAHRCFYAGVTGTYTVTLTISDSADTTLAPSTSEPYVIGIALDSPPCIRRSEPGLYDQLVLLSRGSDLGGGAQSRTFKALSVADDCEPFPRVSGSKASTQFVWSVLDMTQPSSSGEPHWDAQTDTGDSFTVSPEQFSNARPGDTIKVRLEVRDAAVREFYGRKGVVCPDSTDICCGSAGCTGMNDCIRWTTWTVQFLP